MSVTTPTLERPTEDAARLRHSQPTVDGRRATGPLIVCSAAALAGTLALGTLEGDSGRRLSHAWLLNAWFLLSIGLGGIIFVALQHITRAGWSVAVRRVSELLAGSIVVPVVLLLPLVVALLAGDAQLFPWNDAAVVENDSIVRGKHAYLNAAFFSARFVVYGSIWCLSAIWLLKVSRKQDISADPQLTTVLERASAPLLVAMALTITFASFDWLMSLDPHWFSTIFGVYVFSGSMVAVLALLSLITAACVARGRAASLITNEHLHDVTKLLFGFNCFWAYIALSQYLLIWYANIPEETVWIIDRQQHGWNTITVSLAVGHFLLPFIALMPRAAKRFPPTVIAVSTLLLVMHWIDLYWLVYPHYSQSPTLGMLELLTAAFFVSAVALFVFRFAGGYLLVPIHDPRLRESVAHIVH